MTNFDPLVLQSVVLGDLEPADIQLKVDVVFEAKPFTTDYLLGITVTKPDGSDVRVKELIPARDLHASRDKKVLVWSALHKMARKLSFQLFEVDPRIGLPLTTNTVVRFPSSPLFDPPYIQAPFPRYLCEVYDRDERLKPEEAEVSRQLKTCPFCETAIYPFNGSRKPGVWCGGNVGFAHEACAPWVTPRR